MTEAFASMKKCRFPIVCLRASKSLPIVRSPITSTSITFRIDILRIGDFEHSRTNLQPHLCSMPSGWDHARMFEDGTEWLALAPLRNLDWRRDSWLSGEKHDDPCHYIINWGILAYLHRIMNLRRKFRGSEYVRVGFRFQYFCPRSMNSFHCSQRRET